MDNPIIFRAMQCNVEGFKSPLYYSSRRPEKSPNVFMLKTIWASGLVSRKLSSISRVTKNIRNTCYEVLEILLLRIGVEINDVPLANVFDMVLFSL